MKQTFLTVSFVALLLSPACKKKEELPVPTAPEKAAAKPADESIATAPVKYLGAAGRAEQSMEKTIDTAAINNAVELFNVQEGRYPTNLNELVTKKYLSQLPVPPFGSKLQYDSKSGKVSIIKQ